MIKMKNFLMSVGFSLVALVPSFVFALAQDYTDITSGVTAEINAVIPAALGIVALTLGIPIAINVLKRIAR